MAEDSPLLTSPDSPHPSNSGQSEGQGAPYDPASSSVVREALTGGDFPTVWPTIATASLQGNAIKHREKFHPHPEGLTLWARPVSGST